MNLEIKETTEGSEVKPLKFKTSLMNGMSWSEPTSSSNLDNLDKYLENERNNNANEPWSKLDKTAKIKKLAVFAENYKSENKLSTDEFSRLTMFLKDCLDRKKLQRVKDVTYDKTNGEVKDIPALHHNKQTNHFTLKNVDKRVSTTRSLAPKKCRGTAKNIIDTSSDSETEKE